MLRSQLTLPDTAGSIHTGHRRRRRDVVAVRQTPHGNLHDVVEQSQECRRSARCVRCRSPAPSADRIDTGADPASWSSAPARQVEIRPRAAFPAPAQACGGISISIVSAASRAILRSELGRPAADHPRQAAARGRTSDARQIDVAPHRRKPRPIRAAGQARAAVYAVRVRIRACRRQRLSTIQTSTATRIEL